MGNIIINFGGQEWQLDALRERINSKKRKLRLLILIHKK